MGESGWCQCSLLKQGRKGSTLQGGLLICNRCDLPILEGAAARAAFSGDEAAEQVPANARVGAVTTELAFDGTGLGEPNPTSPGWYPDPYPEYHDGWERYWNGGAWSGPWDRRPVGGKAVTDGARTHTSAQVLLWYVLACLLPFASAVVVPWWVMPARGLGSSPVVGLGSWAIGVMGATVGLALFDGEREAHRAGARVCNVLAWALAVVVAMWGLFLMTAFSVLGGIGGTP